MPKTNCKIYDDDPYEEVYDDAPLPNNELDLEDNDELPVFDEVRLYCYSA